MGEWTPCQDCHTNPSNYAEFTCISCHMNPETDDDHVGIGGYIYEDNACLSIITSFITGNQSASTFATRPIMLPFSHPHQHQQKPPLLAFSRVWTRLLIQRSQEDVLYLTFWKDQAKAGSSC